MIPARVAAVAYGIVHACWLAGCGAEAPIPTFKVQRRELVHRVGAEGTLVAMRSTPVTVPATVRGRAEVAWLAPDGSVVAAGELVARLDASELLERQAEGEAELAKSAVELEKARVEASRTLLEIETDRDEAEAEMELAERFQKKDDELYSRNEIIESEIDAELARERRANADALAGLHGDSSVAETALLEIRRREARSKVDQALEGLAALEVRAPHSGLISWVRDWNGELPLVGKQVWRGQVLGQIPDLSVMQAEVFVLEADAGSLAPGLAAEVVLEAHPERPLEGRIERVDPLARPRFRGSPVQYVALVVELDVATGQELKPGQRVRASLEIERLPAALVVPRQAIFEGPAGTYVFLRRGGSFTPQPVEVGASSPGLVAIASGLAEGDEVALAQPDEPGIGGRRSAAAAGGGG